MDLQHYTYYFLIENDRCFLVEFIISLFRVK